MTLYNFTQKKLKLGKINPERLGKNDFLVGVHQVVIGHACNIVGNGTQLGGSLFVFGAHGIEPVVDSGDFFVGAEFFETFF